MVVPPRRIALSGGGMKGIAHVGALEALEEQGLLRCVKEYVGTSSGALIAFCVVLGYSIPELRTLCTLFDFTRMQNLDPEVILEFPERFGLDNGENLDKLLNVLLRAKGYEETLTFEELKETRTLRVFAVDIHSCLVKEFSAEKTPRTQLRMAVRASMSIPFFFTPVRDGSGNIFVDGGLVAHFPFHHLSPEERSQTLGIAFSDLHHTMTTGTSPNSLTAYILQLYFSVYHHQNLSLFEQWRHRIISIPCGQFPSIYFDADVEHKKRLLQSGRDGVAAFLRDRVLKTLSRRNSVP